MTDKPLSVPVLFLEIIYCRFCELAEGPVHTIFFRAGGAQVAVRYYRHLLQACDELQVF